MTRTRTRLALVGIALLMVVPLVPLFDGTASAAEHTFVVEQGGRCVEVSPLRGGEDVAAFYDYRYPQSGDGQESYTYSSYMPDHLTRADGSRLFLYEGPDGVSLVMVHNVRGGDEGDGSAATFRFSGLPDDGYWAVQDDDYPGQDDRFWRNRIDWSWYGDRTDGAAFRGVDRANVEITIDPAFDEAAALYDAPVDRTGDTEVWQFLTGSLADPGAVALDMDRPVTVRTGYCGPDDRPPSAALSAEDGVAGFPVSFDASGSDDDRGVVEYRWDFDGDGEIERETDDPTVGYVYDAAGTYEASVTVVDEGGNADAAAASVSIDPDDPPSATFEVGSGEGVGDDPIAGFPVTFDAGDATDDVGIEAYRWDFDGDGEVERETERPTVEYTYDEAGGYNASMTVVDGGGNTDAARVNVTVDPDDPPSATFEVGSGEASDEPVAGFPVRFDASNASDDVGIEAYRWDFDGDGSADRETDRPTASWTFDEAGNHGVSLTVVDGAGQNATANRTVAVTADDPPTPAFRVVSPDTPAEGDRVVFSAANATDDTGIAEYRWRLGGNATATGERAAYVFEGNGTYEVTLEVVDEGGNVANVTRSVEVLPPDETPPVAVLDANVTAVEASERFTVEADVPVGFTASESRDNRSIAGYRWTFGDGATATGENATHAYGSAGNYTARVAVTDGGDNTASANVTIRVRPARPPNVSASVPETVVVGESFTVEASASDESGIAGYRWTFGDGANATGERATHAFESVRNYTVTLTAVDSGGHANRTTRTVEVVPPDETPPDAALSVGDNRTKVGDAVRFDAGNSTDGRGVERYRWDFDGDGEAERRTANATVTKSYGSAGTYNATVVAVDGGNNTDGANVTVTVEEDESAHEGGGGGGRGGGSASVGPPPVVVEVGERGPNRSVVDVRSARADERVRADLPATAASETTGVRFRELAVALASDDPHFVVETARPAGDSLADDAVPADATLGALTVRGRYLDADLVEGVTYEVAVERSRLADLGLASADALDLAALRAYERVGGSWERANVTVVARGETVVLRVRTDDLASVAVGADRPASVASATLAERELPADEQVVANVTVRNPGDDAEVVALNLTADGEVVARRSVEVAGDDTRRVTLGAALPPGEYRMALDGATLGNVSVVEPTADLGVAAVSVNESTVAVGERVAVTATVENAGTAAGEKTVALTVDGQRVATRNVTVPSGETRNVTFVRAFDATGNYTPSVGNASAALAVREPRETVTTSTPSDDGPNSPDVPIPGFGVGTAVVALVGTVLVASLRFLGEADG